jgi:hypothetical protein
MIVYNSMSIRIYESFCFQSSIETTSVCDYLCHFRNTGMANSNKNRHILKLIVHENG